MFNVNADLFRAATVFQSTEATRYYLAGVFIEPCPAGGVTLTATDGHCLFSAHDIDGSSDGHYIVSLDAASLKACKRDRKETLPRRVTSETPDKPVWITNPEGEQFAFCKSWLVDGTFPDWRRICPTGELGEKVRDWYNPAFLGKFGDAVRLATDERASRPMSIVSSGVGNPAMIAFNGAPHLFGVIMPVRGDKQVSKPAWINARAEALQAAE